MRISLRTCVLALALVLALTNPACDRNSDASAAGASLGPAAGETAEIARVDFTVAGMDCGGCVIAARTALRRLDGVHDAGATFETIEASRAWAVYNPERVTPDRMVEAIGELGYAAAVSQVDR